MVLLKEFVPAIRKRRLNDPASREKRRKAKLYRRRHRTELKMRRIKLSRIKKRPQYKQNKERMLQRGLTPTGRKRVIYTN